MKLYFKQTPNTVNRTMDRLMGGLILQGKEYDVISENGKLFYTIHINRDKLTIYDVVGSSVATLEEQVLGSSHCTIVGINGIQGTFEKMSKEGLKGYKWVSAGYIISETKKDNYDVMKNNNCVMHIVQESIQGVIHNYNYYLDVFDSKDILDGVVITTAMALLKAKWHKDKNYLIGELIDISIP